MHSRDDGNGNGGCEDQIGSSVFPVIHFSGIMQSEFYLQFIPKETQI